jgi:hypothetical protein
MPLTERYKTLLEGEINNDKEPCRRCGKFHSTASCKTPLEQCYKSSLSDLGKEEFSTGTLKESIAEAEKLWKTLCTQKKDTAKEKAKKGKGQPNDKGKGKEKKNDAPDSDKNRKPIPNADLGKVRTVILDTVKDNPPIVARFGVHVSPATSTGSSSKTGMAVLSNYVKVNNIPSNLYVYSLAFSRPGKDSSRIEYNKRREIKDAFDALIKADALGLVGKDLRWVTDYKSLWCTQPIDGHSDEIGYHFQSKDFSYTQPNGKSVTNLRADVTFTAKLSDIEKKLKEERLANLPDYIRALNAYVAQCVVDHQTTTNKPVTRVGANKFYLSRGYVEMSGLRAGRGYFTSIRPGTESTLLNINPATSAFLPPVEISSFIRLVVRGRFARAASQEDLGYISQLLQGASVRIMYTRSNYEGSEIDYNSEAAQLKVFTQFGKLAKEQKFYELVREEGKATVTNMNKPGTSVYDYFTNCKLPTSEYQLYMSLLML